MLLTDTLTNIDVGVLQYIKITIGQHKCKYCNDKRQIFDNMHTWSALDYGHSSIHYAQCAGIMTVTVHDGVKTIKDIVFLEDNQCCVRFNNKFSSE